MLSDNPAGCFCCEQMDNETGLDNENWQIMLNLAKSPKWSPSSNFKYFHQVLVLDKFCICITIFFCQFVWHKMWNLQQLSSTIVCLVDKHVFTFWVTACYA